MSDQVLRLSTELRSFFILAMEDIDDVVLGILHEKRKKQIEDMREDAKRKNPRRKGK